jgi:chlorophyllide a reductase subunit Y
VPADKVARRRTPSCRPSRARWPGADRRRITLSGYEGSELLVARLLIESGADVPYVGTACRSTRGPTPTASGSRPAACKVQFRASLEQDIAAVDEFEPDLAIGTTPVVQHAKEQAIPALYFTNLISARPLMGPAGAGSLAQVVNAAWPARSASIA